MSRISYTKVSWLEWSARLSVYGFSQWQYVDTTTSQEVTQDVDSGGGSATITGIGDVNNGESSTNGESIKQN